MSGHYGTIWKRFKKSEHCCANCVFKNGDELDTWCNLVDDLGESATYVKGELPKLCPLLHYEVIVKLEES